MENIFLIYERLCLGLHYRIIFRPNRFFFHIARVELNDLYFIPDHRRCDFANIVMTIWISNDILETIKVGNLGRVYKPRFGRSFDSAAKCYLLEFVPMFLVIVCIAASFANVCTVFEDEFDKNPRQSYCRTIQTEDDA